MREFDKAVGKLASCCSTMGASYQADWTNQGQHRLIIKHRGSIFTVVGRPTESYFTCITVRRLSNIEGFSLSNSIPVVDIDAELSDIHRGMSGENVTLQALTEMVESESLEYFDGYRSSVPLFVYSDSFGPQQFDESLSKLDGSCREAFNESLDALGLDIDEIQDATGSEEETADADNLAFH